MLPIFCYQGALITIIHGFFCGMHIEGGCDYGYDAIWLKDDSVCCGEENVQNNNKNKKIAQKKQHLKMYA